MIKKGSFKNFIGHITNHIKPLCIRLPQINGYMKYFDSNNKCMNLLFHDKALLKNTTKYGIKLVNY